MSNLMNSTIKTDTPFVYFKQQDRILEEVFITEILFEHIQKEDLNLLCIWNQA